ncbi:MAG: LSU ribosomal protein L9p [uncultured Campylobacterales bacterium]|uniref:Large ribosomal subunit protein bL9 n=1 Tax=uncultured Campylobacterales bacterium TaxID=352960 RepID=A0A6S6TBD9_9BACT|nr:MAG: LSU ribosomal protein L9p [uncultured Campylobacterales bacterium]
MKVLLIKDVKSLGKIGEIKEVKDGYGQNFLINKGFAKLATNEVLKKYQSQEKKKKQVEADFLKEMNDYKEKLKSTQIIIKAKSGEGGTLFGAITKADISEALIKEGFDIDKKHIEEKNPIKHTGSYDISVNLTHGIHGTFNLVVTEL